MRGRFEPLVESGTRGQCVRQIDAGYCAVLNNQSDGRHACPGMSIQPALYARLPSHTGATLAPKEEEHSSSVAAVPIPPTFVRWSPPGMVTVDPGGTTGKLEFTGTPIELDLKIRVTEGSPARRLIDRLGGASLWTDGAAPQPCHPVIGHKRKADA